MAVHHYPKEHYDAWRSEYPSKAHEFANNGAFGENISARGMTEKSVCIGDVYRVGTTRLQVSQARQPCWKLNIRFGIDDMALRVQETLRTGWYYRVLEPGRIAKGDLIELIDRPKPGWPLSKLLQYLFVERRARDICRGFLSLGLLVRGNPSGPAWRVEAKQFLPRPPVHILRQRKIESEE